MSRPHPQSTNAVKPVRFERTFALRATPELVFEALTDSAALRVWFAEHAHVERRVGGAYSFHGVHTPGTAPQNQRLTAYEPGRRLAFTWTWDSFVGVVTLTLSPGNAAGTTALRVEHEGRGAIYESNEYTEFALLDFWRLSVGNLRQYLKTGQAALRPRFENKGERVELSIEIDAPAETVFAALTDPVKMDQWISTAARVVPEPGGTYTFGWAFGEPPELCGPRTLLAITPGRVVEHDWSHKNEPNTRVRWEIEPLGPERCRVTLTHLRPAEDDRTRRGYVGGWGAFLQMLKWWTEDPTSGDLRGHP